MPTTAEVKAALNGVRAIAECIRELGEVPNGELYAQLMPIGMSFDSYCSIIAILKRGGLVEEKHNVLKWIGPVA